MNLKAMREKNGLKQTELAAISGINLRSLQDYEQGHKSIYSAKGETLLRLSRALGYSIEEILGDNAINSDFAMADPAGMERRIAAYEKCLWERKHKEVHFPVIVSDEKVDMSRIYPTKQAVIKDILDVVRKDERVASLRLFGSSISMACNKGSDVDLAVGLFNNSIDVKNEVSEAIQLVCNWGADIIWMDRVTSVDSIYSNIMKGVILV